jgi:hypothetical protein
MQHAYLIGDLVLMLVFCLVLILRQDLRRVMLYSGTLYLVITTPCFFILKFLSSDIAKSVTPGYWSPPTLFNIGQRTGGLAIEDMLFIFFASALTAGLYDLLFNIRINKKSTNKLKKSHAILSGAVVGFAAFALTPINAMYFLIILQFVGAAVLIYQRSDLSIHSLAGGGFFLVFYFGLYCLFNLLFPSFVHDYYHLQRTSHVILLGIPLEEYLYALSFGMLWAPIYEYEHKLKDSNRRQS